MKSILRFIVNNIKQLGILLGLSLYITIAIYAFNEPSKKRIENNVTVIDKMSSNTSGKYSSTRFIIVYKYDNGMYGDIDVTPASYSTIKIGDRIVATQVITNGFALISKLITLLIFLIFLIFLILWIIVNWNNIEKWANRL